MFRQFLFVLFFTVLFSQAATAKVDRGALLKAADTKASGAYVRTRFLKIVNKSFDNTDKRKKLLLIGDSQAQDFYNAILESGKLQNYQIRARYIPFRCQISLSANVNQQRAPKDVEFCKSADDLERALPQIAQADILIFSAKWKKWAALDLPETLKKLGLSQDQKVFVVGRKSFGNIQVRKYLRMPQEKLKILRNETEEQHIEINELMKSTLDKNTFIDLHDIFCGKGGGCPIFTHNLQLISFDGGHLTKAGAVFLGEQLFIKSALASLL